MEEYRKESKSLILPEIEAEHYRCYNALDPELLWRIILQIVSERLDRKIQQGYIEQIADSLSPVECVGFEEAVFKTVGPQCQRLVLGISVG